MDCFLALPLAMTGSSGHIGRGHSVALRSRLVRPLQNVDSLYTAGGLRWYL
jgi:hypothetical protein